MPRRNRLLPAPLAIVLLLLVAAPARADERVPPIGDEQLPVLGTCAPIEAADVTHVRVGARTELRWFAVAGQAEPVDYPGLVRLLRSRAGTQVPSTHGVWITASADHAWVHVLLVRKAALEAGLYRVGVRVRSESDGRVYGFPLFVPPTPSGRPGPKAGVLAVRVQALHPQEAKAPSDVGHAYAAVRRALERRATFGVEKVVATVRVATNAPLQYALSTLDLLYRGGCAGVRVPLSLRMSLRGLDVVPVLEIQGGVASRLPAALRAPPLAPRDRPWSVSGAAEAGWVDFQATDLPAIDGPPTAATSRPGARPNYAAQAGGVPASVWRDVDGEARAFMQSLGRDLLAGLRGGPEIERRFAVGLRRKETLPRYVLPARQAFPDATQVVPSTVLFNTLLFRRGELVGRIDVTLLVVGDRVRVIFGTWQPSTGAGSGTLVPFAVDPFAVGEGASFRVWFEALFGAARSYGQRALPRAESAQVLPYFPAVAHAGVTAALRRREADLKAIVETLQATPYDRVGLSVQRGTATVFAGSRVVGVINFSLRAEEGQLRLNDLQPRRAP